MKIKNLTPEEEKLIQDRTGLGRLETMGISLVVNEILAAREERRLSWEEAERRERFNPDI